MAPQQEPTLVNGSDEWQVAVASLRGAGDAVALTIASSHSGPIWLRITRDGTIFYSIALRCGRTFCNLELDDVMRHLHNIAADGVPP